MTYTKEQRNAYQSYRRYLIRQEMLALLGNKCVQCDATSNLEFDHIDPSLKLFTIASGLDKPRKILLDEIAKCQLLCKRHHIVKTRVFLTGKTSWHAGKLTHGSSCYRSGCRCEIALKYQQDRNLKRRKNNGTM